MLLAPLVRRSWAPRGLTPIFYQRGRSREKVSIIAALSISPRRRKVGLYFSLQPDANVTTSWLIGFLQQLHRQLRHPIILIWDRLPGHRARSVQDFLNDRSYIQAELLPSYAPELNPVEILWAYLKQNRLANLAPHNSETLARIAARKTRRLSRRQDLLRSFLRATPLFLRLR